MALHSAYKTFLANPSIDLLAADSSINYIPTLSTISEPSAILKHLSAQDQQLKKKDEKALNVFESGTGLCLETETTIQFLYGGGTYLPGLDDNLLADRTVTLPITHIVSFDEAQKIKSIRISWDQACLLKAVEVIGSRGKNWPIRDGKDQARLISSTAEERTGRRHSRASGDPHASLANLPPAETSRGESPKNVVNPRMSAKPAPREWSDLFAGAEDNGVPDVGRSPSPKKDIANPLKSGAGKYHQGNRLFDEHPNEPEITVKTNPKKYEHFEFGEGEVPAPSPAKTTKHGAQWDFIDFVTPQKPRARRPNQSDRHFGWSDDEEEAKKPNTWRQHVPKARPDATTHFELNDNSPEKAAADLPKPRVHSKGAGLYQDHTVPDDQPSTMPDSSQEAAPRGTKENAELHKKTFSTQFEIKDEHPAAVEDPTKEKMPLGNITNQTQHKKYFGHQFEITDAPSPTSTSQVGNENVASSTVTESRKLAAKTLATNWALYDDSPPKEEKIKTAGDGMGGLKTGEKPWWDS